MPEPGEVKAARNRAGLTQQQLADILGVHVKTLRDYEKGKRARLRVGQAKLVDFISAHPEPQKAAPVPAPTIAPRPLAEASDMELIAVLTARLALLRAAVDGPIPAAVAAATPTVVVQTVLAPATAVALAGAETALTAPAPAAPTAEAPTAEAPTPEAPTPEIVPASSVQTGPSATNGSPEVPPPTPVTGEGEPSRPTADPVTPA